MKVPAASRGSIVSGFTLCRRRSERLGHLAEGSDVNVGKVAVRGPSTCRREANPTTPCAPKSSIWQIIVVGVELVHEQDLEMFSRNFSATMTLARALECVGGAAPLGTGALPVGVRHYSR